LMQIGSTLTWAGVILFAIIIFTTPVLGKTEIDD
jgi:hypothetical protein